MVASKNTLYTIDGTSVSEELFNNRIESTITDKSKEPKWETIDQGNILHKVLSIKDSEGVNHTFRISVSR